MIAISRLDAGGDALGARFVLHQRGEAQLIPL
jgi:hypothetical protein